MMTSCMEGEGHESLMVNFSKELGILKAKRDKGDSFCLERSKGKVRLTFPF